MRVGLYEPIKRALGATDPNHTPVWKRVTAGALSGLIGSAVCNPADLVKTRMQAQPPGQHHSIGWHTKDIYNNFGGFKGFYYGVGVSMMRATSLGAVYLSIYDTIKHELINRQFMKDGVPCQFAASVVSGFFNTLATTPFDNMKTRIMNEGTKAMRIKDS